MYFFWYDPWWNSYPPQPMAHDPHVVGMGMGTGTLKSTHGLVTCAIAYVVVCNYDHANEQMQSRGANDNPSVIWAPYTYSKFFMFYFFFLLLSTCFFFIFSFILIMTPPIPHDACKHCVTAASLCSQGANRPVSGPWQPQPMPAPLWALSIMPYATAVSLCSQGGN